MPYSNVPLTMPRVRLLIADDDVVLQMTLKDLLEMVTASVIVGQVDSVPALCTAMQEKSPDIVLLDWHLPGQPDTLLLERLHEMNARLRIIVLNIEAETIPKTCPTHADVFINKGESAQQLFTVLAENITQLISLRTRPAFYA